MFIRPDLGGKVQDVYFSLHTVSGRVLNSRPRGHGFEPHWCHCVVSLSKNINPSLVLVQPRKTRPVITERLLIGRNESNQTKQRGALICALVVCNQQVIVRLFEYSGGACIEVLGIQDICHFTSRDIGYYQFYFQGYGILCSIFWLLSGILTI